MALQELQIYGLWAGKNTNRTTPAAASRRFKQLGGAIQLGRGDGKENYSDLTQYTPSSDWVDSIAGNGAPVTQGTPEELAWLLWILEGGETTASVTGPPAKTKHTAVPLPGLGHWSTWMTRQGSSVVDRLTWNAVQIAALQVEGGTAAKAVRATPTILSLDPAVQLAADPATALTAKQPFLYTDGTSRFTIDGTTFRGHSAFTLNINKDLQPVYSDDVYVQDLAIGNATITITVTLVFDSDALAQWNKLVYGTTTPAATTKPMTTIPAVGSYGLDLRARTPSTGVVNGDKFVLTTPQVKWQIPDKPAPNPGGGSSEITLSGEVRHVAPTAAYTIDIDCDAAAFTTEHAGAVDLNPSGKENRTTMTTPTNTTVTIGTEEVTIGHFSAFKAFLAMDIIASIEGVGRQVVSEAAAFKRQFEAENIVTLTRAEARLLYRPRPLFQTVREETDDGRMIIRDEPMMIDGEPVMGPDPLGHLTDADWAGSDNRLVVPTSPSERMQIAAMIPTAFKLGRAETLRLLALALTANRDLEEWDGSEDITAKLDDRAKKLEHDCSLGQITDLAAAVLAVCKAEVSGPLARLRVQVSETFGGITETPTTQEQPMTVEATEGESDTPSTSSTDSPAATDGIPEPSSTEPASESRSPSPIA